ncbi:MAG: esterase/lipase family protein [Akkermansiaceae bacterium]
MPWHKPRVRECQDADTVVLLHGLWRSVWAMEPMAKFLHSQGYGTINVPYPSFTKSLEDITALVMASIRSHAAGKKVHFVTHSLGGIVMRRLLENFPPEELGRIVMLAPPNQGSEIIDWLADCPPLKCTLGPAGDMLASDKNAAPPLPSEIDSAVIMGKRSTIPFFRWLLDDSNDGIVSVERGRIEGMNEFHVMDADHTFISSDERVMAMTQRFLRDGRIT